MITHFLFWDIFCDWQSVRQLNKSTDRGIYLKLLNNYYIYLCGFASLKKTRTHNGIFRVGGWAVHVEIEISESWLVRSYLLNCSSKPADWWEFISYPVYLFILPLHPTTTNSLSQKIIQVYYYLSLKLWTYCYDNTVATKVIADIWENDGIKKMKWDRTGNVIVQMFMRQVVNKPTV